MNGISKDDYVLKCNVTAHFFVVSEQLFRGHKSDAGACKHY